MYKADLEVTENKFESVKRWFDKNNLPYPGSHKDRLKKELLKDYTSQKRKKVVGEKKKDYNQLKIEKEDQNKEFQILLLLLEAQIILTVFEQ